MNYQEVKKVSLWEKIKSALIGIIVWPILVFVSIYFLAANEFRAVERSKAIIEWEKIVTEIDVANPSSENNNTYIYTKWKVQSSSITESDFQFNTDAVVLDRTVRMYQWKETAQTQTEEHLGWSQTETTTYTYSKEWSAFPIDSSDFNQAQTYQNPKNWAFESQRQYAQNIQLGNFGVSESLQHRFPTPESLKLASEYQNLLHTGSLVENMIFIGNDINNPEIWDLQISYSYLPIDSTLSILGGQRDDTLLDIFLLKNWQDITEVRYGNVSSQEIFQSMKDENTLTTWIWRWGLTLLMFLWFNLFLSILPTLWSIVPMIGRIAQVWVALLALLATIAVAGTTIAVAWFLARPIVSLIIIAILIGSFIAFKKYKK